MTPFRMIFVPILLTTIVMLNRHTVAAVDTYQQRCTEATTTSHISDNTTHTVSTLDSCDSSKLLACRGGRCECADPINHIYTSLDITTRHTTLSRRKRSPKGKGKKWIKAAIGGAVVGGAAYQLGKYVANSQRSSNNVHHVVVKDQNVVSEVQRIQSSSSAVRQNTNINGNTVTTVIKRATIYGCLSRVNADCVIDRTKKSFIEKKTTSVSNDGSSITTVITKHAIDYKKFPLCIQHAQCKPKSTFTPGQDSNIGECICKDGYQKTNTDICVSRSG